MAGENHWGAPRIYSELLMLGFNDVSEATVSRLSAQIQIKTSRYQETTILDDFSKE